MIGDLPFFFVLTPLLGVRAGITSSTSDEADSSMSSSGHCNHMQLNIVKTATAFDPLLMFK